ncbi:MAG: DUF1996 domain-containing protein [Actinomycetota bacterium]
MPIEGSLLGRSTDSTAYSDFSEFTEPIEFAEPPLWARTGVIAGVIGVAALVLAVIAVDVARQAIRTEDTTDESALVPSEGFDALANEVAEPGPGAVAPAPVVVLPGDDPTGATPLDTEELAGSSTTEAEADASTTVSVAESTSTSASESNSSTTRAATAPPADQATTTTRATSTTRRNTTAPPSSATTAAPKPSIVVTQPPTSSRNTTTTARRTTTTTRRTSTTAVSQPPGTGGPGTTERRTTTTQRRTTTTTERRTTTTASPPGPPAPGSWVPVSQERASYNDSTVAVTHHIFDFLNSNAPDGWGLSRIGFVVHCDPVMVRQIDPIVNPGQSRSGHAHEFFGNPNVNPNTTTQSLADTPRSQIKCTDTNDKSAYWTPTVLQNGREVGAHHFKAYYKSQTPDTVPMPFGLRMVAGNAGARTNQSSQIGWWQSGGNTTQGRNSMISKSGNLLTLRINFPQCWDGKHLDSPDHKSHMAYAKGHKCPASHPVKVPQVVTFTDYRTSGGGGMTLSSGEWYTFHQDFWNAWSPGQMDELNEKCILAKVNCRARRSPDLVPRGQKPVTIRG